MFGQCYNCKKDMDQLEVIHYHLRLVTDISGVETVTLELLLCPVCFQQIRDIVEKKNEM